MTNEYENHSGVTAAATEVINGVTYEVIYLDGNNTANLAKVANCNENTGGNYRYVMTADWDIPAASSNVPISGHSVILDLNGYTFSVSGWLPTTHSSLSLYCDKFEVTDTSTAQSGVVISGNHVCVAWGTNLKEIIVSGGVIKGAIALKRANNTVIFNGGSIIYEGGVLDYGLDATVTNSTVLVAPYMIATYNASGSLTSVKPRYDHYAVSTTPYASGVYNYAYGLAWELNATQLAYLEIPADKTYYLWGRNQNGWYESLNLRYVDGAWQNAA